MKQFALIGAAGYVAPRHMKAIKDMGGQLAAALDKNDSVGVIDNYFPEASFFVEFERFDRHLDKLKRNGQKIDYLSICSPNYLHDSHIRFGLRSQLDAICEKPLVLNPWNLEALEELEKESGKRVWSILQLRLHPSIIALKEKVQNELKSNPGKVFDIDLSYITGRGRWYQVSWKGDETKSGGLATNIGVHFYDMLSWIFGEVKENIVHLKSPEINAGLLTFKNAKVRWFLSMDVRFLPKEVVAKSERTYRSLTFDGVEVEFSGGFTDLHTKSYEEILAGRGFGLNEVRPSIEIVSTIRNKDPIGPNGEYHPFCEQVKKL